MFEVIGIQYTALCENEKNEKNQHTNTRTPRSRSECLWMMPSISPLITCKTLHCCAPSVISTQNKRQPTSNPQHPGFNNCRLRGSECLWMMPSISPLITCKTLHCCAPSVISTQNKRQPTSNPQHPGFNNCGLRGLRSIPFRGKKHLSLRTITHTGSRARNL